ncbi:MAG TPA: hypothetical protein VGO23_07280 [Pseudonocardia sp.]|nr:hypothetical protein [Pseudonocardia sp.]
MLARPALADVTLPATARFVDAFAAAIASRTESYPGALAAAEFALAADAAERAWAAVPRPATHAPEYRARGVLTAAH